MCCSLMKSFEYLGGQNAKTVFVAYGTHVNDQWKNLVGEDIGLIQVRVPVPFNQDVFSQVVPQSTKKLVEFKYPFDFNWTPITIAKTISKFDSQVKIERILPSYDSEPKDQIITANTSPEGNWLFWSRDDRIVVDTVDKNKYDNSKSGGVFFSQISSTTGSFSTTDAAVVVIEDLSLLNSYDILATAKPGATVIYINQKQSIDVEKLPLEFKKSLALNHNKLVAVDFTVVDALDETNNDYIVNKLLQANGGSFELLATVLDNFIKAADLKNAIVSLDVLPEWQDLKEEAPQGDEKKEADTPAEKKGEETSAIADVDGNNNGEEEVDPLPFFVTETSVFANPRVPLEKPEETNNTFHKHIAQKLVFPEAFKITKDLRPDLPVKNFVVKVQENKRLTPAEYSRNISILNPGLVEVRSARQILSESIDFLGKPPKRFYESLALAEGAEELKKRQDVNFDSYFDILEEFKSARPKFADLVNIIAPLKRREYSIASSQKIHPNAVHLLIVVVDWVDPKGD
ncbi:unnamed protein product [Candida parapsilosis]